MLNAPLLRDASLPNLRWYELRHSCATLLLSGGTYPTHVQKLLGYASLQLTLDRYSHWIPQWASTPRARLGSFGVESTADVLLTKCPTRTSGALRFYRICRQKREPTSGLEPLTPVHYE